MLKVLLANGGFAVGVYRDKVENQDVVIGTAGLSDCVGLLLYTKRCVSLGHVVFSGKEKGIVRRMVTSICNHSEEGAQNIYARLYHLPDKPSTDKPKVSAGSYIIGARSFDTVAKNLEALREILNQCGIIGEHVKNWVIDAGNVYVHVGHWVRGHSEDFFIHRKEESTKALHDASLSKNKASNTVESVLIKIFNEDETLEELSDKVLFEELVKNDDYVKFTNQMLIGLCGWCDYVDF
jgi:hypothetical protein